MPDDQIQHEVKRLSIPLREVKFADGTADGTFAGYGAVFSIEDLGGDVIKPGAFRETLREWKRRKKLPKMLLEHGYMHGGDLLPVGVWDEMEEDDVGLRCKGHLFALDTDRGKYLQAGLKSGVIDALSLGYRAVDFSLGTKVGEPRRTIRKMELFEVSIVLAGMNGQALIDQVKSVEDPIFKRTMERFLRDAGLSKTEAKAFIAEGLKALPRRDAVVNGDAAAVLEALRAVRADIG